MTPNRTRRGTEHRISRTPHMGARRDRPLPRDSPHNSGRNPRNGCAGAGRSGPGGHPTLAVGDFTQQVTIPLVPSERTACCQVVLVSDNGTAARSPIAQALIRP